jgi:AraC-like DNA-binding protein
MTTPLAETIERLTGEDGIHATSITGLTLYRRTAPSEPTAGLLCASLCLVAQGAKEVRLGDGVYRYDPDQFLLSAADMPIESQVISASHAAPYLALSLELDQAMVCELAAQVPAQHPTGPSSALAVSPLDADLLDAVTRLVALAHNERDRAVLAPLATREIAYRLLAGAQGSRLRQIAVGDGSTQRIVRALRWLREHYTEPLRIESLAREVRLSPSALHQHFKSVTAMSPLQYQKQLRLHEARRLMLSDHLDAAEACFRVGYESPSQFSREYRRLFGAPPRQDIAVVRSSTPAVRAEQLGS